MPPPPPYGYPAGYPPGFYPPPMPGFSFPPVPPGYFPPIYAPGPAPGYPLPYAAMPPPSANGSLPAQGMKRRRPDAAVGAADPLLLACDGEKLVVGGRSYESGERGEWLGNAGAESTVSAAAHAPQPLVRGSIPLPVPMPAPDTALLQAPAEPPAKTTVHISALARALAPSAVRRAGVMVSCAARQPANANVAAATATVGPSSSVAVRATDPDIAPIAAPAPPSSAQPFVPRTAPGPPGISLFRPSAPGPAGAALLRPHAPVMAPVAPAPVPAVKADAVNEEVLAFLKELG